MAIPKKGSRKIVVNDIVYRWRVRWKPSYAQECEGSNFTTAVELFEEPKSVLHITFPWVRYDAYFGVAEKSVTPKLIEQCIKNALQEGWQPNKNGVFELVHKTA